MRVYAVVAEQHELAGGAGGASGEGPVTGPSPECAQRLDGVALASQASGEISRRMNSS